MGRYYLLLVCLIVCLYSFNVCAEEIYLENGDKITGSIIEETESYYKIETEVMGNITIHKKFVNRVVSPEKIQVVEEEEKEDLWKREIGIGYDKTSGNTSKGQLSTHIYADRKTDYDEINIKVVSFYSSSDKKMDGQKWSGMARYAKNLRDKTWHIFYRLESDHDRFANIDYRIIPSAGLGHWFRDQDDWKLLVEGSGGYEYSNFRDSTKSSDEAVFIGRTYLEKKLIGDSRIKEDLLVYPSLSDGGEYRLRSETSLVNPLSESMSLNISLINDYDSDPPKDTKKHDMRLITSILYSF